MCLFSECALWEYVGTSTVTSTMLLLYIAFIIWDQHWHCRLVILVLVVLVPGKLHCVIIPYESSLCFMCRPGTYGNTISALRIFRTNICHNFLFNYWHYPYIYIHYKYSCRIFTTCIHDKYSGKEYRHKIFLQKIPIKLNIQHPPMYGHVMHFLCSCQHCMYTLIEYFYCTFFFAAIYEELEKGAKIFVVLYAGFQDVWVD